MCTELYILERDVYFILLKNILNSYRSHEILKEYQLIHKHPRYTWNSETCASKNPHTFVWHNNTVFIMVFYVFRMLCVVILIQNEEFLDMFSVVEQKNFTVHTYILTTCFNINKKKGNWNARIMYAGHECLDYIVKPGHHTHTHTRIDCCCREKWNKIKMNEWSQ